MNDIPCINPVCSHLFSAHEVARANVLKCPECGQQIQVRAEGPPATKPAPKSPPVPRPAAPSPGKAQGAKNVKPAASARPAPPARPVPVPRAVPVAPPAPRAVPLPDPPGPSPAILQQDDSLIDSDAAFARSTRRSSAVRFYVGLFAVAFIVLGSVLAVFLLMRRFGAEETEPIARMEQAYEIHTVDGRAEPVFKVVLPRDKGWSRDDAIRKKLKTQAGWHDRENQVRLAVMASDFDVYRPREAELIRIGMEHLSEFYDETLEVEQLPAPSRIAGEDAKKLIFKGRDDGTEINWGEMHFFSYRGIGYWVFVIAPELEVGQNVLKELHEHKLGLALDPALRKHWREQPPRKETFFSISGMVSLTVPHGVYEKTVPLDKEIELPADLSLLARYRKEKDNRKNAHVQVFRLKPRANLDDAMKQAREHVLAIATAGEGTGYALTVSPDVEEEVGEMGKSIEIDGRDARVGEFCLLLNGKRERFVVLAVLNEPDGSIVVVCDVAWDNRQIWHQDFQDLIGALRVKRDS